MKTYETPIHGCLLIETEPFLDFRGGFEEAFNRDSFRELGLPEDWAQDNISVSKSGVIRGLHMQSQNAQGKLIRCIRGTVWDVVVDARPDSPTFMQWHAVHLNQDYPHAFYLPPGTLHGFAALEDNSTIYYKCTTVYDRSCDGGVRYDDPDLQIPWPVKRPVVSLKDQHLPRLVDYLDGLK